MTTHRCLSTLEPLDSEGYSARALASLSDGAPFPSRLDFGREDFFTLRQETHDRMSISGVQDKLSLRLSGGRLVAAEHGGTYILKPIPGGSIPRAEELPANEHVTMLIASRVLGVETAAHALIRMEDGELAYITRRFDRGADGHKIPQEDFCQLLGRTPDDDPVRYKYTGSYEEVARTLDEVGTASLIEKYRLFELLIANYLLANGDAHLKNFSVGLRDGIWRLTPAYDLVCTRLHLPEESRLALDLLADDAPYLGEGTHGFPTGASWLDFASTIGLRQRPARRVLERASSPEVATQIEDLVERSFLGPQARRDYLGIVADRRQALSIMHT